MTQIKVSREFMSAVQQAIKAAMACDDEAVRFMVAYVPIYAQYAATPAMAQAGGCINCTYHGLWIDDWPSFPAAPHGLIFLFEAGIRSQGGDLVENTYGVLLHEMGHALQRDHVLDAMRQMKAAAMYTPRGGCRACPG